MSRTIIVGDIHGCIDELHALLERVSAHAEDDVISVGDLVGKGPGGAEVVEIFAERGYRAVLGNHDHALLSAAAEDRIDQLPDTHRRDAQRLSPAGWAWLKALPHSIALPAARVVHGGLMPNVSLSDQDPHLMMNLRSIDPCGRGSTRRDGDPWASRWRGPEKVYFGHDAARGIQRWPYALGLDSGCVYGGQLSAWVVEEARLYAVDARRRYREPNLDRGCGGEPARRSDRP